MSILVGIDVVNDVLKVETDVSQSIGTCENNANIDVGVQINTNLCTLEAVIVDGGLFLPVVKLFVLCFAGHHHLHIVHILILLCRFSLCCT